MSLHVEIFPESGKAGFIHHTWSLQIGLSVVKVSPPWSRRNDSKEGQIGVKRDLSQPAMLDHSLQLLASSFFYNACYSNQCVMTSALPMIHFRNS